MQIVVTFNDFEEMEAFAQKVLEKKQPLTAKELNESTKKTEAIINAAEAKEEAEKKAKKEEAKKSSPKTEKPAEEAPAQSDEPAEELPFSEDKKEAPAADVGETEVKVLLSKKLKAGKSIKCPVYDFTQHNRSDKTITIHPSRVIVVEGILIFQDERLRDAFDIKIFVEADADERILRRVVRDMDERGRELQDIIEHYLATVKPMHYLYVEPTRNVADIVLNSGLNDVAFDVMKTKIESILENPDED